LLEGASNIYIVQAYKRVPYLSKRFDQGLNEMFKRVRAFFFLTSSMSPMSLLVFAIVMIAVTFYGMRELRTDNITVEQLVAYFSYAIGLVASTSQVGYLGGRLRQASVVLAKHGAMLISSDTPRTTEATRVQHPMHTKPYGFAAQNITFTYPDRSVQVLTDVSFNFKPGVINAIIGESGAGKSTLAALLCGLYRPQSGSIYLTTRDGIKMDTTPSDVSQEIAFVPQEPFLFGASVLENITFGREGISEARVRQVAMAARIHDFIMALPNGYRTVLQEGARDLSRGQRQRISIARALAGDPSVIVLDEATSSLDVISESVIKTLMEDLRGSVTFVVIAHRGALLSGVDHVIALHLGQVSFEGPPRGIDQRSQIQVLFSGFEETTADSVG
jgi:ATP-binding cassette, subfamily B, bacterial